MIEILIRWKNWLRIKALELFTSRIQRISVKDDKGKEHEVTIEKQVEKVCDHKTISEIAPTLWKCSNCDIYFQINYKVMLTDKQLVEYLDQIATHLKLTVSDHA